MTAVATTQGLYLYAITEVNPNLPEGTLGLEDQPVSVLTQGRIAVIASPVTARRFRPERRNLSAHQRVLSLLQGGNSVLPMSFGIVASDEPSLREILTRHETTLLQQLDHVRGRMEMGLRVGWAVPNVFEHLLNLHPDLRAARDRAAPTREAAMAIGRQVEQLLAHHRASMENTVRLAFGEIVVDFHINAPKSDDQLLNAACLVPRDAGPEFEKAVGELAAALDDTYRIDFNGPWAPHNFIQLNLAF